MAVFHPDPTCFAPSNLWATTGVCRSYFPPFSTKPADYKSVLPCPTFMLGPHVNLDADDSSCYQSNDYGGPRPTAAYTACPDGMTSAGEDAFGGAVTTAATYCCPTAYDFTYIGYEATNFPLPTVIDGETYSVIIGSGRMCKATSVKPLIEKTVTVTVTTSPDLVTTVVAWDYETDLILASAAALQNYIYVGGGTTSTCIGAYNAGCDGRSNPLSVSTPTPTPTRAPESSYVAPPSHPVTQFTPAPSCLAESNLWFVSTDCYLTVSPNDNRPPWLSCTMTEFGEPDLMKTACYGEPWASTTVGRDGTESFYATCPVGYTTASVSTTNPFDKPLYATAPTERFDVVVSSVRCCPSGHDFKFTEIRETSTSHNGRQYNVQMLPMPACVATHVKTLSGEKVTMKLYSDSQVWDKRQEETPLTTTAWDYEHDTLWARHMNVYYTVFHGTYTCYEKCDDYFTYSYHNTDPNAPTTTSDTAASETTSAGSDGGGGDRDKSGANAVRGDGLWMLAGAAIALWIVQ